MTTFSSSAYIMFSSKGGRFVFGDMQIQSQMPLKGFDADVSSHVHIPSAFKALVKGFKSYRSGSPPVTTAFTALCFLALSTILPTLAKGLSATFHDCLTSQKSHLTLQPASLMKYAAFPVLNPSPCKERNCSIKGYEKDSHSLHTESFSHKLLSADCISEFKTSAYPFSFIFIHFPARNPKRRHVCNIRQYQTNVREKRKMSSESNFFFSEKDFTEFDSVFAKPCSILSDGLCGIF